MAEAPIVARAPHLRRRGLNASAVVDFAAQPGVNRAPFARAMIPTPPYLLDAARRWNPQQLDWIVDHGIKMTAMPAWGEVLPREQVQDVVGFLTALPDLSAADCARLRTQATLASAPVSASAPPARSAATSRQVEAGRGD